MDNNFTISPEIVEAINHLNVGHDTKAGLITIIELGIEAASKGHKTPLHHELRDVLKERCGTFGLKGLEKAGINQEIKDPSKIINVPEPEENENP